MLKSDRELSEQPLNVHDGIERVVHLLIPGECEALLGSEQSPHPAQEHAKIPRFVISVGDLAVPLGHLDVELHIEQARRFLRWHTDPFASDLIGYSERR